MGDPYKTRLIAQAQIKTDKLDARKLAQLLRGNFINSVHIPTRRTRQRKNVLRQRLFWVKQRRRVRNRVYTLLERQRSISLPQVSDLFGKKWMGALKKLELPRGDEQMLLKQDLGILEAYNEQIKEIEEQTKKESQSNRISELLLSVPGIGPVPQ